MSIAEQARAFAVWMKDIDFLNKTVIIPFLGNSGTWYVDDRSPQSVAAGGSSMTNLSELLPPERPPMRVAEQGASLDLASEGRLEVALLPEGELSEDWAEGYRMIVDMWDAPTFSWGSERFEVRPIDVVPKPHQKPHPALWLVGWSDDHARAAGRGAAARRPAAAARAGAARAAQGVRAARRSARCAAAGCGGRRRSWLRRPRF